MITYEQLNEVFDRPVEWKYKVGRKNGNVKTNTYSFQLDDREFLIDFSWVSANYLSIDIQGPNGYKVTGENKDQFKVYSTVMDIFKSVQADGLIPKGMLISAFGATVRQQKMYDRILDMLVKKGTLVKKIYGQTEKLEYFVK